MKNNSILIFSLNSYDQLELFFTSLPHLFFSLPLTFPSPVALSQKKNRKNHKASKQWEKHICFSVGILRCLKITIKVSNCTVIDNTNLGKKA